MAKLGHSNGWTSYEKINSVSESDLVAAGFKSCFINPKIARYDQIFYIGFILALNTSTLIYLNCGLVKLKI